MTSRQRVEKAVSFQVPDRVPIDLGGMKASGIAAIACDRVKQRLGIRTPTKVADARFMIAHVDEELLKRLHVDVVPMDLSIISGLARPDRDWVPRTLFDGTRVLMMPGTRIAEEANGDWRLLEADGSASPFKMPRGGYYFDDDSFDQGDGIDPTKYKPIDNIADEDLELMARYARELYDGTDYALLGWGFGVCFLGLSLITARASNVTMAQPSEWMAMLLTEPETCHAMMDRSVEATIKCLKLAHQAVGDRCFAWGIAADDAGTQRGEFVNPDLWAEMLKPHYTKVCSWIHKNTNWKTFLHSCGSVRNLIPHFIEAGVDILNPVQTSAANMDAAELKKQFAGRIVFWGGGCDTQGVLGKGTPEQVREQVKERIGIFAPGGGYVFNQVHNIQANVPPENVIAMLDAAYEYGRV